MRLKCSISFCYMGHVFAVEQSAQRVPVFSSPHNGADGVENLWIMKSLTQGHVHRHTLGCKHAPPTPHLCKTLLCPCAYKHIYCTMFMGAAGIAVLLLWEAAAAPPKVLSSSLCSSPLIYQLP